MIEEFEKTHVLFLFFVYCGSIFESRKDLTVHRFKVIIQATGNSPNGGLFGESFTTTSHPTVFCGADENSGDKSAGERTVSG